MQIVSIWSCRPMTCSTAERNSSARRPWVTRTIPIMLTLPGCGSGNPYLNEGAHMPHLAPRCKGRNSAFFACRKRRHYKRKCGFAFFDRKPWKFHAENFHFTRIRFGHARAVLSRKIDDQPDRREGLAIDA